MSMYPELDAKRMLRPILSNYNAHVLRFLRLLENLSCDLVYEGPPDFRDHVRDKTVYACSILVRSPDPFADDAGGGPPPAKKRKKTKILKCVFPVMIGSNLDHCIRKRGLTVFSRKELVAVEFLDDDDPSSFAPADVAASFFLVNGCVRQLPYFYTNDPTNTHVVRGRSVVRCYTYDADDRGKEISYFAEGERNRRGTTETAVRRREEPCEKGDLRVVLNDGTVIRNEERRFFDHCPYRTEQTAYMDKVYRDGRFDIDHLGNKVVVSPGHLFTKLFVKYLYRPLKARDWSVVKPKHAFVVRSIETGTLLHVLSKKTVYFKDPPSTITLMANRQVPFRASSPFPSAANTAAASSKRCCLEGSGGGGGGASDRQPRFSSSSSSSSNRSGGGGFGSDVYVEKKTGCYREISMQTYPLNPYLSYLITRQISNKVSHSNMVAYHPSYVGFLCLVGSFETKNIGRTSMMVRDTTVSFREEEEDVSEIYRFLRLTPPGESRDPENDRRRFYVVVNEACVRVEPSCFRRTCRNLEELKRRLKTVECYHDDRFVYVRCKIGILFKKLHYFERRRRRRRNVGAAATATMWVTSRDERFWKRFHGERLRPVSSRQLTTYIADLNPFLNHNVFTKNILAFNTLKNAILSTDPRYSEYFAETLSAYAPLSPRHRTVCEPVDAFSARFTLRVPLLTVAYANFKGLNQEDCIVLHGDVRAFDCYRFHTVRVKMETPCRYATFHPTRGDPDPEGFLLGHLVSHDDARTSEFKPVPQTMHTRLAKIERNDGGGGGGIDDHDDDDVPKRHPVYKVYFYRSGFGIRSWSLTKNRLVVCLERFHPCRTGDKLTSFHGQKGVVRIVDSLPVFGRVRDRFGNVETADVLLLVNPYCLSRMTLGQIHEARFRGGRDHDVVWNSDGKRVATHGPYGIFAGETFYIPINYLSAEHIHAPFRCTNDPIFQQPLRGRSQNGGMRMGNMELLNGMRGNGLSGCFEEKAFEHSDRIFHPFRETARKKTKKEEEDEEGSFEAGAKKNRKKRALPPADSSRSGSVEKSRKKRKTNDPSRIRTTTPTTKAIQLIREDLKCFKVTMGFRTSPYFLEKKRDGRFVDFFGTENANDDA